jgi:large subunit ribosomal protein L32e
MAKKFLRRTWHKFSKLGKGRKKKQKWRRPTGRDNKMREKRKGYPAVVSIGYGSKKNEKNPVNVYNIKDLESVKENEIAVIGNVGEKKRIEMAKFALEKKIKIHNLNSEKFLKNIEKKKNFLKKKSEKSKKETKKTEDAQKSKISGAAKSKVAPSSNDGMKDFAGDKK